MVGFSRLRLGVLSDPRRLRVISIDSTALSQHTYPPADNSQGTGAQASDHPISPCFNYNFFSTRKKSGWNRRTFFCSHSHSPNPLSSIVDSPAVPFFRWPKSVVKSPAVCLSTEGKVTVVFCIYIFGAVSGAPSLPLPPPLS